MKKRLEDFIGELDTPKAQEIAKAEAENAFLDFASEDELDMNISVYSPTTKSHFNMENNEAISAREDFIFLMVCSSNELDSVRAKAWSPELWDKVTNEIQHLSMLEKQFICMGIKFYREFKSTEVDETLYEVYSDCDGFVTFSARQDGASCFQFALLTSGYRVYDEEYNENFEEFKPEHYEALQNLCDSFKEYGCELEVHNSTHGCNPVLLWKMDGQYVTHDNLKELNEKFINLKNEAKETLEKQKQTKKSK